jgi:hypothetical protein
VGAKVIPENVKELLQGDGCTGVPDFWWRQCCDQHDKDYSEGVISRAEADKKFYKCLRGTAKTLPGKIFVSFYYYAGVRIFGGKYYNKVQGGKE